jgi:hypothetical protein
MISPHFCDNLPFEEDLALYLNKLEFPSTKDNLYQVWLILAGWFWRFLKKFSVFLLFRYHLPLKTGYRLSPSFEQSWILFIQIWFMPSLVKIGPVVLEIFKWPHPIFTFCDYLPFKEDLTLYLNKLEFPSTKDNLYQVWLILATWFCRRFNSVYFYSFAIISPWRRVIPFIWTNLNPLHPRMSCAKVWLKLV